MLLKKSQRNAVDDSNISDSKSFNRKNSSTNVTECLKLSEAVKLKTFIWMSFKMKLKEFSSVPWSAFIVTDKTQLIMQSTQYHNYCSYSHYRIIIPFSAFFAFICGKVAEKYSILESARRKENWKTFWFHRPNPSGNLYVRSWKLFLCLSDSNDWLRVVHAYR